MTEAKHIAGSDESNRYTSWPKRVMSHVPYWVLALILMAPITVIDSLDMLFKYENFHWLGHYWSLSGILFIVALFLVGPIKRLNWRHAMVMLAFAAAALVIGYGYGKISKTGVPYPYMYLIAAIVFLLPLGIGEGLLSGKKLAGTTASIAAVIVTACLFVAIIQFIYLTDWRISTGSKSAIFSSFCGIKYRWPMELDMSSVLSRPVLGVIIWIMILLAMRIVAAPSRRLITIGITTGAVCVSAFLLFACSLYRLADRSLSGLGPYSRWHAVSILAEKGDQYRDRLLGEIEKNWNQPGNDFIYDWRRGAFEILNQHATEDTAKRLSALLLKNPNAFLAEHSAPILARYKRYETVPILMRYALEPSLSDCNKVCTNALWETNLPRAAIPIWKALVTGCSLTDMEHSYESETVARERLVQLLGEDAGDNKDAWLDIYNKKISRLSTPLPKEYAAETDRVIACYFRYGKTVDLLVQGRRQYLIQRVKNDGKEEYLESVEKYVKNKNASDMPDDVKNALVPYLKEADRLFTIEPPNWDSPTTESLEKEISDYEARVKTAVDKAQTKLSETELQGP